MRTIQPSRTRRSMDRATAESLAIEALAYLAADQHELDQFIALTGLTPGNLRDAANDPQFLSGVLDHMMASESLLLACAANLGRRPEDLANAARVLSGPESSFE
ncbi:MAG: DUF3572 domain-containing protein [Candidatus Competibacteraceae bacterium]|nr:DUF3572 domain-containing protein [Candidatus Competibacteraceae bacterium]